MQVFDIATMFAVLLLLGVEISVFVFVDPSAWRLEAGPQLRFLSHFAGVLGKVMPFWYSACLLLLGGEAWFRRGTEDFWVLLAACAVWLLTSVLSMFLLVPLNTRVAEGAAGWQEIHHRWDRRHRVRVAALLVAAGLLARVLVR